MECMKYIGLLAFILLIAGVATSASAFHIEREQISAAPDSLTTRENVTISELIRFEYLNGSTFPENHFVRCRSDLDEVRWTYEVMVDGDLRLRETNKDPSFSISGFVLSYHEHAGQSMKVNLTVEGRVPEKPVGTEITLLKVWQVDPTGAPLPESHYTYLKEGRITKKFMPPTPEPTPTPAPTILSISSMPEGALVFVDDRVEGTTPCTIEGHQGQGSIPSPYNPHRPPHMVVEHRRGRKQNNQDFGHSSAGPERRGDSGHRRSHRDGRRRL